MGSQAKRKYRHCSSGSTEHNAKAGNVRVTITETEGVTQHKAKGQGWQGSHQERCCEATTTRVGAKLSNAGQVLKLVPIKLREVSIDQGIELVVALVAGHGVEEVATLSRSNLWSGIM